jgi:D-threo-aldose 1-dehydrogenase
MLRTLPDGKTISRIGFGCSSIWAKGRFPADKAEEIIETAYAHGINYFDTSPSYGWGEAERRLGDFIKRVPRDRVVISTKVGTFKSAGGRPVKDFSPAALETSLTDSLARLGVERVDMLFLHGPAPRNLNEEVFRYFEREKSRGRIAYSAVNSFQRQTISQFVLSPLDVIMLQYNVADFSTVDLFDDVVAKGKMVIAASILAQGVTQSSTFVPISWKQCWYLARAIRHDPLFLLKGFRISRSLASFGLTAASDLIRFVVSDERVLCGVFGSSDPVHVAANAKAASLPLSRDVRDALYARLTKLQRNVRPAPR